MLQNTYKIVGGKIITPYRIIDQGTLLITGDKIAQISEGDIHAPGAIEIDARGNYVSPGFIDIHIHGGGGHDFMDGNETAFLKIAETHARFGTTAMVPTTLTSTREELLNTLDIYKEADKKNTMGAKFIGMHLEGPYFSPDQRGAQDPRFIRNPDPKEYEAIIAHSDVIKRWSAAPELPGAIPFGRYLKSKGIIAAIAHTDAIYEETLEAFENGYTLATHLYSCMSGVTRRNAYRYAGVIESAYLIDEMDVEIIADGIHLPAALLQLVYKIKGTVKTALITDAMRGAGMPPGDSILGNIATGMKVIVEDGVAKLPDRSAFAGSVATTDRLVRNMVQMAHVPLTEAIKMISTTPARIMGIQDSTGSLIEGKQADVVIFDENIDIRMTMVNGHIVYTKP
ncbi:MULTISPECIES: N-acetylglucosamine-6-phosphate deacetylase [Pedobacter]|uniref:N-acetylglucosamine-6-phosphate deacetylase n=1 Tax=Pedobacter heparinus (strain ATCC 13125 / DSM 2366 / CIP 104194 / JCM 7457 / NBRC 12017 / NCIMB 9290 / NRRL B-14731 / HIM 762-3) TaxID=485917 RepID=C6XZA2_PEDHD|nr:MULTISPECIES: N-acetylglucosamine-6-phosphate deacetylase [Pedobacter]ACU02584.1 N-acetylglucosamine-6-phosphate deacetylase [Pedobacter heparinus DSM 2366]MBB5439926.1 N-acetylglucosamine-6-phosphate deacetylase [Pedobacter sp. AK017]